MGFNIFENYPKQFFISQKRPRTFDTTHSETFLALPRTVLNYFCTISGMLLLIRCDYGFIVLAFFLSMFFPFKNSWLLLIMFYLMILIIVCRWMMIMNMTLMSWKMLCIYVMLCCYVCTQINKIAWDFFTKIVTTFVFVQIQSHLYVAPLFTTSLCECRKAMLYAMSLIGWI